MQLMCYIPNFTQNCMLSEKILLLLRNKFCDVKKCVLCCMNVCIMNEFGTKNVCHVPVVRHKFRHSLTFIMSFP